MAARTDIPNRASYEFVMRRRSALDPQIPELVVCYGQPSQYSHNVAHHDGARRRTVFLTKRPMRDRLLGLGWEDVTQDFDRLLNGEIEVPEARKASDPRTVAAVETDTPTDDAPRKGRRRTTRKQKVA